MSFKPPLPRIAGPFNLPTLLSILPKNGEHQIVKPSTCKHPNRVFLVTKSKLKYTSRVLAPTTAVVEAQKSGAKVAATQVDDPAKKVYVPGSPVGGGEVQAHGKIWALEFINGALSKPRRPTQSVEGRLRTGLKYNWIAVDPTSLPSKTAEAVKQWRKLRTDALAEREKVIKEKEEVIQKRQNKRSVERRNVKEKVRMFKQLQKQVTIVY